MKNLPNEKAPGPDGFTNDFYKCCWQIIKADVFNAFQAFYNQHCGTFDCLNRAQVVLIPKVEVATDPKDYRPISLIHSFAKLLTKVLAMRLSVYIDKLISTAQSAFIRKRCIQDNFTYVRGLARHYRRTRTLVCLIKFDITKAFDSVSWEYILQLLVVRGFPARLNDWLSILLRTSSSVVLLNGCLGDSIKHRRGLRKGDPLSPYLFILAIDVLNSIFNYATEHGFLSRLKGRQARLRISMYADNAVVFTNPSRSDVSCIMAIMRAFGDATGLHINMHKSTVAPIRCQGLDMDEVLSDFPGPRVNFPIQYLGLPLTLGRLKMVHLQYIHDRAKARVSGWQGRLLNVAGRRELVRSVLSSLPVYALTALKLPKNFLKELDKLRRRFLWAGDKELTGGKCKVAWTNVCKPIVYGGLGIVELERFGRALRLRWLWYAWDSRSRPWEGLDLPVDKDDIALFNAATVVAVGNGQRASFWSSRWLHGHAPATLYPNLFKHSKRKNRSVQDAITDSKWVIDVDHNMTEILIQEFVALWEQLQGIVLQPMEDDKITWLHTLDGCYSASSAYKLQFVGMMTDLTPKCVWSTKAPPKCRFFTWLLLQNRLWTAARLQIRGWPNDYFCSLCIRNLETASHLFQECCFSLQLWDKVGSWIAEPSMRPRNWAQIDDLRSWYLQLSSGATAAKKEGVRSMAMLTMWELEGAK